MTSVALSDWLVDTTKITRALNCKHNVMNGEGGTRESTSFSLPVYEVQLNGITFLPYNFSSYILQLTTYNLQLPLYTSCRGWVTAWVKYTVKTGISIIPSADRNISSRLPVVVTGVILLPAVVIDMHAHQSAVHSVSTCGFI